MQEDKHELNYTMNKYTMYGHMEKRNKISWLSVMDQAT